jgi:hypothetical protein
LQSRIETVNSKQVERRRDDSTGPATPLTAVAFRSDDGIAVTHERLAGAALHGSHQ